MPETANAMSGLGRKLRLKAGQRAGFIHAPEGYLKEIGPLPEGVEVVEKLSGKFDWVQVFVKNKAEIDWAIRSSIWEQVASQGHEIDELGLVWNLSVESRSCPFDWTLVVVAGGIFSSGVLDVYFLHGRARKSSGQEPVEGVWIVDPGA